MSASRRQFDPVAAAASSAINASVRSLRAAQEDLGAPEVPNQNQAAQAATQGINQVAQVSPFNIFARGGGPSLPGMSGSGAGNLPFPTPQGMNVPSPQQFLPGQGGAGASSPFPNIQTPQGVPSPDDFVPSGGGGSSEAARNSGSSSDTGVSRDGGRSAESGR